MIVGDLPRGKKVAADTETTGLYPWLGDAPFAFSFCNRNGDSAYVQWDVDTFTRKVIPDPGELKELRRYFRDTSRRWIFHHAKFDVRIMEVAHDIIVPHECVEDTMFMAHCCNTLEPNYKLKDLADRKVEYPKDDETELKKLVGKLRRRAAKLGWKIAFKETVRTDGTPKFTAQTAADYWLPHMMAKLHPDTFSTSEELAAALKVCQTYAVGDVYRTMLLDGFYGIGMKELGTRHTYEFEMRELWPVIYDMETYGPRIHRGRCQKEYDRCRATIDELLPRIKKEVPWPDFNIDSHPQLRKFLYEVLKLPVVAVTKTGLPSTSFGKGAAGDMLKKADIPAVRRIVKVKSAAKAINSFFGRYLRMMKWDKKHKCWCLHAHFEQRGPATTRLSCKDPNLQNVAGEGTTLGAEPIYARRPFMPREKYWWLLIDYDNMEVRVFAYWSREEKMLSWLRSGRNVHTELCNMVWGGENNPEGLKDIVHALEIDGSGQPEKNHFIMDAWRELGVNPKRARSGRYTHKDMLKIGREFFGHHEWDIVVAEKALDKAFTRVKAKILTFTKIYGGGWNAVWRLLKCPEEEAKGLLKTYDRMFPRIPQYARECAIKARENDWAVLTPWGDRISVDPLYSYRAVNYETQGSSAMLLKRRMVAMNEFFKREKMDAHLVMPIHDELVNELHYRYLQQEMVDKICAIMADHGGVMDVDMPVEPKIVRSEWSTKEKVEDVLRERRIIPIRNGNVVPIHRAIPVPWDETSENRRIKKAILTLDHDPSAKEGEEDEQAEAA